MYLTGSKEYLDALFKTTALYAVYVNATHPIDDAGNDISGLPIYTGYAPAIPSHYSNAQAVDLYNHLDMALADDTTMTALLLQANDYFEQGQFAPGVATVDLLTKAMAQWQVDLDAQNHNSAIFSGLVQAAIAAGTGAMAYDIIGAGAVADAAANNSFVFNAAADSQAANVASDFVFNAAADSQAANVALNLPAYSGVTPMDFSDSINTAYTVPSYDVATDYVYNAATDSQLANLEYGFTANSGVSIPSYAGLSTASSGVGTGWTVSGIAADLTTAAKTALSLLPVYKMLTGQPMASSSFINPQGATVTPMPNGTLVTRNADGTYTTTPMTVGQVYTFPDGSSVVNNGNGTYTRIAADGTSQTLPLPTTSALGNLSPVMLGVLAVGAFMLLRK
jgi:hypothetical protein